MEKYGVVHINTGDLLRAAVAARSSLGIEAHGYMTIGKLVPDGIVVSLVQEKLDDPDVQERGWLFDGFPRTQSQALCLRQLGINPTHVIFLDVPDSILTDRAVGRRLDPETGIIYHIKTKPPPTTEIAKRLIQRDDDVDLKVKNRLVQYHSNLQALKDTYKNILMTVNGNQDPNKVFEEIDRYLSLIPTTTSIAAISPRIPKNPLPRGVTIVEPRFVIHLRCKQISKTNTQLCTLVYGFEEHVDLEALCETFKLAFHCGGHVERDELFGRHIRLMPVKGDIKDDLKEFMVKQGYARKDQITLHVSLL